MIYKFFEYLNKKKIFKNYILVPRSYSFGDCCEQIKLAALHCCELKKNLLIIPPKILQYFLRYDVCNNFLLSDLIIKDKYSQNIIFSSEKKLNFYFFLFSIFLNLEFFFRRTLALVLKKFFNIFLPEIYFFPDIGIPSFYNKKKEIFSKSDIKKQNFEILEIDLNKKENLICKEILKKIGLDENSKFVCLHIRDGQYKNDYRRRSLRNCDISKCNKMIKYLVSKNYFVIRLGRVQKEKIKINHPMIIDYAFSDIRSDIMDLYLLKNCNFFVGNLSGPLDAAHMFDRPVLALDVYKIFEAFPKHRLSRSVFRKVFDSKNDKIINIRDFINLDIFYHHFKFKDDSLDYLELTEEEIYNEIIEYVDLIEGKISSELTNKQINFNKYLIDNLLLKTNNLIKDNFNNKYNEDIKYYKKMLFYLANAKGSYSSNFLKLSEF